MMSMTSLVPQNLFAGLAQEMNGALQFPAALSSRKQSDKLWAIVSLSSYQVIFIGKLSCFPVFNPKLRYATDGKI